VMGLSVAGSLWWAYFDVVATRAGRRLANAGHRRVALGQAAYTYLHLPMLAGIVLVALGLKKVLEYAADAERQGLSTALPPLAAIALFGGAALFLLGSVSFAARTGEAVNIARPLVAVVLVAVTPVAVRLPALAALGLLVGALVVLDVWESLRDQEAAALSGVAGEHPEA
jgi:low temperature requirement protein LtrA